MGQDDGVDDENEISNDEEDVDADDPAEFLRISIDDEWRRYRQFRRLALRTKADGRPTNPLDWWIKYDKLFPLIASLARKVLAVPASEAPSERVFSKLSLLVQSSRSRLSKDVVSDSVFLSMNSKVFQQWKIFDLTF